MKRPLIVILVLCLVGGGWFLWRFTRSPESVPKEPLIVHFTADVSGRLEPCGCFTGQYGGLTRLATMLGEGDPHDSLRVDVGDALAGPEDYERLQHQFLSEAFARMNFAALNIGVREASLGIEDLRSLVSESAVPMVSANVLDASGGKPVAQPHILVERAGWRIAITGVVDPALLGERSGTGLRIEDMNTALSNHLDALEAEQADYHLLLAFTTEEKMRELARRFYEFDLILGGEVPQPSQELIRENDSYILFTTNEARAAGHFVQPVDADQAPDFEITLLHDGIPESKDLLALSVAYRDLLRETPLDSDSPETLGADNRVPGTESPFHYVGSEACAGCHAEDYRVWKESGHSHAFDTLIAKGADADPNCIRCHTIGFGEPSGYRRSYQGKQLASVGCESCHGPGSEHVAQRSLGDPSKVTFHFRPLGKADCTRCHYGEFSRPFDWNEFWPPVQHGASLTFTPPQQP